MHLRSSPLSQTKESSMSYGRKIGRQRIGSKKIHRCRLSWLGSGAINTGFSSISGLTSLRGSLFYLFCSKISMAHTHLLADFPALAPEKVTRTLALWPSSIFFFIFFLLASGLGKLSDFDNPSAQRSYYCFDWWNYHVDLKLCRLFRCLSYFFCSLFGEDLMYY